MSMPPDSASSWPGLPPDTLRPRKRRKILLVAALGLLVLGALGYGAYLRFFVYSLYYIPNEAMEPTLHEGDHFRVNRQAYRSHPAEFGDIIVFKAPKEADLAASAEGRAPVESMSVKRVIGTPGETVEIKHGAVYRNGRKLNEPYIKEPMSVSQPMAAVYGVEKPLRLGPNQLFVLGDNRNDSNDSRYWGPLNASRVVGKVDAVLSSSKP